MTRLRQLQRRPAVQPPELSAYDSLVLAESGLVMYQRLDGTGTDLTGRGHTAVAQGGPTVVPGGFINGDDVIHFDGNGDYYEIADHADLSVATTGILCVEFWYRPTVHDFTNEEPAASSPSGYAPYTYFMGKNNTGQGSAEWHSRMYSRHQGVDWLAEYGINPARPNRTSIYVNNLGPIPPATVNLGAGSYYQDTVTLGDWIHYFAIINCADTSALYPQGYTKIFKNGSFRAINNNAQYNITPQDGTAPVRIACAALTGAFWEGDMGKVAFYNEELSAARIRSHFLSVVPSPPGSAGITELGVASRSTTGRKLRYTLTRDVPAGSRIVIFAAHSYTAGNPSVADSGINTYSVLRAAADTGDTVRGVWLSGQVDTPLFAGDQVQLTTSADTDECAMKVFAAEGIDSVTVLDSSNSGQSTTNSTTPGINTGITNNVANVLLLGSNVVVGPISDTYTEDDTQPWTGHTRAASTGPLGLVLNSADQPVNEIQSNRKYRPTLGTARQWLSFMLALKAGTPVVNPPVTGSAELVEECGSLNADASSNTLVVPFTGDAIPVGHTVLGWLSASHTATNPTIVDSAGHTYQVDRAGADGADTLRGCLFSAEVTTEIVPGVDELTITWPSAVTDRNAGIADYAGLLVPTEVDVVNGASGNSAAPSVSNLTTNADDLILCAAMALRPASDTPDSDITFRPLTKVGGANMTIYPAFRSVGAVGTYTYAPDLSASAIWINLFAAYKAGA